MDTNMMQSASLLSNDAPIPAPPEMTALGKYRISLTGTGGAISVEWFRMLSREKLTTEKIHSHNGIELHFLLSGRHTFYFEEKELSVEAMEGIVVPAGCEHRLCNTGTHYVRYVLNILFSNEDSDTEYTFLYRTFEQLDIARFTVTPQMAALLRECALEAEEARGGSMILLKSNIQKLLVLTARELCDNSVSAEDCTNRIRRHYSTVAEEAVAYIEEYLSDSPTVDDVARYMHISKKHLGRIFRRDFRCSVQQKTAQLRLKKAKALLQNSTLSVGEIAGLVGYLSAESFSRFFSRMEGQSPLSYRNATLSRD